MTIVRRWPPHGKRTKKSLRCRAKGFPASARSVQPASGRVGFACLGRRTVVVLPDSRTTPGGAIASCGGRVLNAPRWSAELCAGDAFLLAVFGPDAQLLGAPTLHLAGWRRLVERGELPAGAQGAIDRAWSSDPGPTVADGDGHP